MKFYEIYVASDWPYLYVHTYISLPLTYCVHFPYLSFAMQAWVFAKKFRHVRGVQYIFVQQSFGIVYKYKCYKID